MLRLGLVVMLLAGCTRDGRGDGGKERGDCRAGSACDPGLVCLSNVCVRPPAANCALVGETLASLDLGHDAEPAQRAPVVAKYKAACETVRITQGEAACLDKAKDTWSAGQCAPRMFPEQASASSGDCMQVAEKLDAAVKEAVHGDNPQLAEWSQMVTRVMRESCEQDAWPETVKQCILGAAIARGADAMQACNQQMPPALQAKLQQRLQMAMHEQVK